MDTADTDKFESIDAKSRNKGIEEKKEFKIKPKTESKKELKPTKPVNVDDNKIEEMLKSKTSEESNKLSLLEKEREKRLNEIKSIRNSINKRIN